jgi:hypothetical protein
MPYAAAALATKPRHRVMTATASPSLPIKPGVASALFQDPSERAGQNGESFQAFRPYRLLESMGEVLSRNDRLRRVRKPNSPFSLAELAGLQMARRQQAVRTYVKRIARLANTRLSFILCLAGLHFHGLARRRAVLERRLIRSLLVPSAPMCHSEHGRTLRACPCLGESDQVRMSALC